MLKLIMGALTSFVVASCASGYVAPESRIDPETGQKVTVVKARDVPSKMEKTNEEGEELICRSDLETGSRVRKRQICATQAQWDALDDNKRELMRDIQRNDPFRNEG